MSILRCVSDLDEVTDGSLFQVSETIVDGGSVVSKNGLALIRDGTSSS